MTRRRLEEEWNSYYAQALANCAKAQAANDSPQLTMFEEAA